MNGMESEERCRKCGKRVGYHHGAWCPYVDQEPGRPDDDRLFDPYVYGRLEDDLLADRFGEPRRYP